MYLGHSPLFDLSFSTSNLYYTLSSLLAFAILSLAYSRVRGLFGLNNEAMSLTVKWGRERFVSILFSVFPLFDSPLTCLAFTALLLFLPVHLVTRRHIRLTAS
jgi:hypothetical protein